MRRLLTYAMNHRHHVRPCQVLSRSAVSRRVGVCLIGRINFHLTRISSQPCPALPWGGLLALVEPPGRWSSQLTTTITRWRSSSRRRRRSTRTRASCVWRGVSTLPVMFACSRVSWSVSSGVGVSGGEHEASMLVGCQVCPCGMM